MAQARPRLQRPQAARPHERLPQASLVGSRGHALKIVFAALHNGYYRNLESVVEACARRGHQIFLGAERDDSALGGRTIVERLAAAHPNVTFGPTPRRERRSLFFASRIRLALDFFRYLEPEYVQTPALRRRAEIRTPSGGVALARTMWGSSRWGRRVVVSTLDRLDHAVAPSAAVEAFLDEQQPDVVVITPLIGLVASSQLDLLRSAQARRIRTAVCVWSWDHLSSKAIIRDLPDRLFVWNNVQKDEAVGMHHVPAERVVVTGAQNFDRWFVRMPSRDRSAFAAHVGLRDAGAYVLWVCSALFPGSPSEAEFVMRWVRSLRASSDPAVRNVNVLIRPHPSRGKEWEDVRWREPGVAMWGGNPIDEASRADYFDSLHHSAAVVGLNTSAFIEAGIVGRPVMAILPGEFHESQEGTLHFRYLLTVGGGLLTVSRSLEEHEQQLSEVLAGRTGDVLERQRRFVEEFVRPRGLQVSATEAMADELEALAASLPVAEVRQPTVAGRLGLWLLTKAERTAFGRRLLLDEREIARAPQDAERDRERAANKAARLRTRDVRRDERRRVSDESHRTESVHR